MREVFKKALNIVFCAVPVLCMTSTAVDSFVCASAVIFSYVLALAVSRLGEQIIPKRVKNIIVFIFIMLGISLADIFLCCTLPVSDAVRFLPLSAVSTVLLLGMTEKTKSGKRTAVSAAVTGGLFFLLLFLFGSVRELLGYGTFFTLTVTKNILKPAAIFSIPAGAIFLIAVVIAVIAHAAGEETEDE